MAVAFVQQGLTNPGSGSQGTTFTVTLPTGLTAGGTLVLTVAYSVGISSVTGCSATWTRKVTNTDPGPQALVDTWIGTGGTAGKTTVTVNFAGTTLPVMNLSEWSGVNSTQNPSGTANGSASSAATPAQTPASGDAVYGVVAIDNFPGQSISSFTDSPSAWTALSGGASAWMTYTLAPAFVTGVTTSASRQGNFSGAITSITQSIILSSSSSGASSAAATWVRTARTFALATVASRSAVLSAARGTRTFTAATGTTAPAIAGRPDATTATGWGRLTREFYGGAEAEPPVEPPPATRPPTMYRRAHYTYTAPTLSADGWSHPTQDRTLVDNAVIGRHRFKFEGIDRTYFRGVPVRLVEDSHANPFGPEFAVLHFPQISPFELPPAWLDDGAWLVVTLVTDTYATVPGSRLAYFVHNRTPELTADGWGLTVEAKGFLYEGDDEINKPLPTTQGGAAAPIGYRVAAALNSIIGRRFHSLSHVDTSPAVTRSRGSLSQTILSYVRDLLGTAWTSDSRQWTVLDVVDYAAAHIVLPNPAVVDYTLSAGQDGVTFNLHEEQDEQPNVVYGEWVDANGGRHQRLKYPRLHEDKSPDYPLSIGAVFTAGDGHAGFQPFSDWMRRNGFSSFDSQNTYLSSDVDDVEAAQKRMGITVDGVVGAQTWGTAFNTGADVGDLRNAIYLPIAWDPRVEPYLYAPDGAKIGPNPAYDATVRRKEIYINFGEGLTYRDVRRSAQQIVTRNTTGISLVGEIEINDTDFEEVSKLVARAGTTLRVRYLYGTGSAGMKFHLARIHRAYGDDGTVKCTLGVDTKWRDAYTVAQIIDRNKEARRDPARLLRRAQTSGLSQDTKIQFDADDIGRIYRHNVQGGFWRIVEFPAASWGTWVHVTAVTSPATEFALMLFSQEITARDLDRLVGNPLSASHPYNAEATALKAAGLIQAWGSADQPAGYSKANAADGYKSDGDTLTGRLEYDSSVEFAPANGASLFLAEWCAASTVIHETFELQPVAL